MHALKDSLMRQRGRESQFEEDNAGVGRGGGRGLLNNNTSPLFTAMNFRLDGGRMEFHFHPSIVLSSDLSTH